MSRIDELITQHAPGGVEYKALGDLAAIAKERVDGAELDETSYVGVDNLLPNFGGRKDSAYVANSSGAIRFRKGDVLLGNIRPYLKKVWFADRDGGASPDVLTVSLTPHGRERLMPKFLYYVLASDPFISYSMQHTKGAKMPRGDKKATLTYRTPVPPVEVQREIVRILDAFTELGAELEAELEARRQQYGHYTHELLSRPGGTATVLGNALSLIIDRRGITPKKLGGDWTAQGHRVVSALNVKNGVVDDNDHHYVDDEVYRRWMPDRLRPGDVLLTSEAPLGAVAYIDSEVDWAIGQRLFALRPDPEMVYGRFLYHMLRAGNPRRELVARATGSTVTGIRQAELVKVTLVLPGIEEQWRIASILDSFDALVNDLSSGLPAEIEARRQQYAYYRDRLLTFEEAVA